MARQVLYQRATSTDFIFTHIFYTYIFLNFMSAFVEEKIKMTY